MRRIYIPLQIPSDTPRARIEVIRAGLEKLLGCDRRQADCFVNNGFICKDNVTTEDGEILVEKLSKLIDERRI